MYSQDGSGQKYWQVLRTCDTLKQAEKELESLYTSPLNTFMICEESAL